MAPNPRRKGILRIFSFWAFGVLVLVGTLVDIGANLYWRFASVDDGGFLMPVGRIEGEEPSRPWNATLPLSFPRRRPSGVRGLREERVPRRVHFAIASRDDEYPAFSFLNFVAVASVLAILRPESVVLHCAEEPVGFLWHALQPYVDIMPSLAGDTVEQRASQNGLQVLRSLSEDGGIYLDLNMLALKPLDALLRYETVVQEPGVGPCAALCSPFVAAAPGSPLVRAWYDEQRKLDASTPPNDGPLLAALAAQGTDSVVTVRNAGAQGALHVVTPVLRADDVNLSDSQPFQGSSLVSYSMDWFAKALTNVSVAVRAYIPDPLISVVVPCSGDSKFVVGALASVTLQTFKSWDIVVVEDPTPEGCGRWLDTWLTYQLPEVQRRIQVIVNAESVGRAESFNIGVRAAKGLWICALDPDDMLESGYFAAAVTAIAQEPDLTVIGADQQFFDGSTYVWKLPNFTTPRTMKGGPLPGMTLYLRDLWTQVGGYTTALPWGNEDYDFWVKALCVGVRFTRIPQTLVKFRLKRTGSDVKNAKAYLDEELAMMRSMHPDIFHAAKLFREHRKIMGMSVDTQKRLEFMQTRRSVDDDSKAFGLFWLALWDIDHGYFDAAVKKLSRAKGPASLRWQVDFYAALCECRVNAPGSAPSMFRDLRALHPLLPLAGEFLRVERDCQLEPSGLRALAPTADSQAVDTPAGFGR